MLFSSRRFPPLQEAQSWPMGAIRWCDTLPSRPPRISVRVSDAPARNRGGRAPKGGPCVTARPNTVRGTV
jgi:hypothetical protein